MAKINSFIITTGITNKKYYLYVHTRVDNSSIFYVGIGTKQNDNDFSIAKDFHKRNTFWKRVFNKTDINVFIFLEADTKEEIIAKEINYIALIGKRINNQGTLVNLTDGGEG